MHFGCAIAVVFQAFFALNSEVMSSTPGTISCLHRMTWPAADACAAIGIDPSA